MPILIGFSCHCATLAENHHTFNARAGRHIAQGLFQLLRGVQILWLYQSLILQSEAGRNAKYHSCLKESQMGLKASFNLSDLCHGPLIRLPLMQQIDVFPDTWTLLLHKSRTTSTSFEGERHQYVCSSDGTATQILSIVRRCLELRFQEFVVSLKIWLQERIADFISQLFCDWHSRISNRCVFVNSICFTL